MMHDYREKLMSGHLVKQEKTASWRKHMRCALCTYLNEGDIYNVTKCEAGNDRLLYYGCEKWFPNLGIVLCIIGLIVVGVLKYARQYL